MVRRFSGHLPQSNKVYLIEWKGSKRIVPRSLHGARRPSRWETREAEAALAAVKVICQETTHNRHYAIEGSGKRLSLQVCLLQPSTEAIFRKDLLNHLNL